MSTTRYLLVLTSTLAVTTIAKADFFWTGGAGDGNWNTPGNWSADTGPNFNADRFVNNGMTATIPDGGSTIAPIRDVKVAGGAATSGTVNNAAGVHASSGWVFVGLDGGNGTYNLANTAGTGGTYTGFATGSGTVTGGRLYVGLAGGGTGTFNLNTSGTLNYEFLAVGDGATGVLNIDNGSINTTGETWIGQGAAGIGTVRQSGGVVNSSDWLAIGRDNATAVYTLSGGTLQHSGANHTIIGSLSGKGTLDQTGGLFSEVNDLRLGENAGGVGIYNLKGGSANVNGWTVVGWTGTGTGELNVGGSTGTATLNSGYVEVGGGAGGAGNGTVNLLNNGVIETRVISRNGGAISGQVNFNGGILKAKESNGDILPGFSPATSEILAGGLKVDTNGFDTAIGTGLDGVGGLTKLGLGKLTLNGVSTYSGATVISQGTLALGASGSLNPSSVVNVAAGATFDGSAVAGGIVIPSGQTLSGSGTTVGNTTVNGTVAPGDSIGQLTITGNLTLNGVTNMEIDRTGVPAFDEIKVSGILDYGGTLNVSLLGGSLQLGDSFDLFDAASFTDTFAVGGSLPALGGDWYWQNNLGIDGSIRVLPEPSSTLLAGLAGLGLMSRRRRA